MKKNAWFCIVIACIVCCCSLDKTGKNEYVISCEKNAFFSYSIGDDQSVMTVTLKDYKISGFGPGWSKSSIRQCIDSKIHNETSFNNPLAIRDIDLDDYDNDGKLTSCDAVYAIAMNLSCKIQQKGWRFEWINFSTEDVENKISCSVSPDCKL